MSTVAIDGAGPYGAAIAHKLVERARVRDVVFIDEATNAAAGKALDIQQSGPVNGFDVRLSAAGDLLAAAGAPVVVLADPIGGAFGREESLARLSRLLRSGTSAAIVLAGPEHTWLQEAAARELGFPADRLVGTAASAQVAAARALVGVDLGRSGTEVSLTVTGRPPGFVVGWTSATAGGSLVTDQLPPHRLLAISDRLRRLWPPGPQAVAAATARIVEALIVGSRVHLAGTAVLDGEFGVRGVGAMLPLELAHGRIQRRIVPSLSPQEHTELANSLARA